MNGRVICLGECLIDRLFSRLDPASGALATWQDLPGGAPANVAAALAKLGTPAAFVGCLGCDATAEQLLAALQAAGVDCGAIQRHPSAPTRVVLVMRDAQGERQFVGFHQPEPASFADAYLSAAALDEAFFAQATYLVMGTLGLAYPETAAAMQQALRWAKQHDLTTFIDLNWRPAFWAKPGAAGADGLAAAATILPFVAQADWLKLAAEEAHWLFGTTTAAAILAQLPQLSAVIVTAGGQGCSYATQHSQGQVPAFAVDSEDSTGAGDAFLAGLIHQLQRLPAAGLDEPARMASLLRYASAVGALTTTRAGAMAAQPSAREVDAFLYLHPQRSAM